MMSAAALPPVASAGGPTVGIRTQGGPGGLWRRGQAPAPAWRPLRRPRQSGWLLPWLLWPLLLASAGAAPALELPELAALLAQRRNAAASFTEDRFVGGLDQPLRSSGTLSFTPPDRFTRTTLQPRLEVMSVDGNQLTLERGGRTRRMALDALPEASALMDAMRGVLSGDLSALQSAFDARVLGTTTRWRLSLRPRGQRLGGTVQQLDIEGEGPQLRTIEVLLSGGDRSLMTVRPVDAPLPPAASPGTAAPARR